VGHNQDDMIQKGLFNFLDNDNAIDKALILFSYM